ncbi:hypothetical protein Nepgr_030191 [Nepenthes gracilis]|uniref:Uncharacterized protein n=1 Tax=Nepenthes gracilis TaxID=150966 RepID=A0AAD3Y3Y8_NEPGR|nr:hypothetical protein Nepgr_030191 [Nepenthes gracilis]
MAPDGISMALGVLPLLAIFSSVDRRAVNHKLEVPAVSAGVQWSAVSTPLTKFVGWHGKMFSILARFQLENMDPVSRIGKLLPLLLWFAAYGLHLSAGVYAATDARCEYFSENILHLMMLLLLYILGSCYLVQFSSLARCSFLVICQFLSDWELVKVPRWSFVLPSPELPYTEDNCWMVYAFSRSESVAELHTVEASIDRADGEVRVVAAGGGLLDSLSQDVLTGEGLLGGEEDSCVLLMWRGVPIDLRFGSKLGGYQHLFRQVPFCRPSDGGIQAGVKETANGQSRRMRFLQGWEKCMLLILDSASWPFIVLGLSLR